MIACLLSGYFKKKSSNSLILEKGSLTVHHLSVIFNLLDKHKKIILPPREKKKPLFFVNIIPFKLLSKYILSKASGQTIYFLCC